MTRRGFFAFVAVILLAAGAEAGPTRELFQTIESKHYADAERDILEQLQVAQGEDRNAYLFVLGFVLVKQGRPADAQVAIASMDPKSEWAADGEFLLKTYGAKAVARSGEPEVRIEITGGPQIAVGRDRFTRSGRTIRKNGKAVPVPHELKSGASYQGRTYRGRLEISVERDRLILTNVLPVEEYLYGVLKNEIGPGWHEEALKAQAIASRTFVIRRMDLAKSSARGPVRLAADVTIQVYRGMASEDPRITAAVDATRGQVVVYGGEPIEAVFHSESGGATESSRDLWGRGYPYLISKPDPYSGASPRLEWEAEFSEADIQKALDKQTRSKVGRIKNIEIAESSQSGRVKLLAIEGTRGRAAVPAGKFRLGLGPDKLRSLLWTDVAFEGRRLSVKGRGWGHGVGLPQWSAKSAAEQGLTAAEILQMYYPGTAIVTRY